MDTFRAFARGMASRGNRVKVFDWDKAAKICRKNLNAEEIRAGLHLDMEYTATTIMVRGDIVVGGGYLSSTWAIPVIEIDGVEQECWTWADETEWDEDTMWPDSARKILGAP